MFDKWASLWEYMESRPIKSRLQNLLDIELSKGKKSTPSSTHTLSLSSKVPLRKIEKKMRYTN